MTPLHSGFSKIGPQNLPPPPSLRDYQTFHTPPGNIAISN